jgi:cell division protein FtsB
MRELEQRRHPIYVLSLRFFTVVLLLVAFVLIKGVWGIYNKERGTYSGRAQAEKELLDIENRETSLRAEIARLRSPQGVEEALRQQFDMAKEGERVIVIVDRAPEKSTDQGAGLGSINTWKRFIPIAPWKLFGQ